MDPATVNQPHSPSGKTMPAQDYHHVIDELSGKVGAKVIKIRHDIHNDPELSNRESRTAGIIADHLKSLNFDDVHTEVGVTGDLVGLPVPE